MRTSVQRSLADLSSSSILRYGLTIAVSLLVALAALAFSHKLTLGDPVVIGFVLLLMLPAIVTVRTPALGLALVLLVSLISSAVPLLIPQLSTLGPETAFGVAVLTAWVGLLVHTYRSRERLIGTPLLLPLLVWNLWTVISFVVNIHSAAANHNTLFTIFLWIDTAFFVLAANAVRTERVLRRLLLALVFSSIPLSVIAYLQYSRAYLNISYAAIHPGLEKLAENLSYTVRVAGTLSDAAIFSAYYMVVFVLAVAFLSLEQSRRLRIALALTIAFDLWPFLMTFTKSTLIAIVLALLALAWLRRSWMIAGLSLAVSAASWLALTYIPLTSFFARQGVQLATGAGGDDATNRVAIMKQCVAAIPSHALLGAGPLGSQGIVGTHCHSLPLELLVDYGLIGTLLFGWFVWQVARLSWRARLAPPATLQGVVAHANLALLVGFAVMALLWPLVNFPLPWYWVVVALIIGGGIYKWSDEGVPSAPSGEAAGTATGERNTGRMGISVGMPDTPELTGKRSDR